MLSRNVDGIKPIPISHTMDVREMLFYLLFPLSIYAQCRENNGMWQKQLKSVPKQKRDNDKSIHIEWHARYEGADTIGQGNNMVPRANAKTPFVNGI